MMRTKFATGPNYAITECSCGGLLNTGYVCMSCGARWYWKEDWGSWITDDKLTPSLRATAKSLDDGHKILN